MLVLFLETGIATKLECEDLETVTSEDIALEVSFMIFFSFFILPYDYKCEKFLKQCSSGLERNGEAD